MATIADGSEKYWQLFASQIIKSSRDGGGESGGEGGTVATIADGSEKYWQLFASQLIKSSSDGGGDGGDESRRQ